uniref:Uncharacterized protein n=1 Tax=viral metagenome TaxID=1070528 RepID=A0A6C0BWP9_9ZZZZ
MSASFITNENIDLLWEIILEEEFIRKVVSREKVVEFRNYFIVQLKEFYNVTSKLNIPLVQLNKQFITNFIMVLQPAAHQTPKNIPNKQLYTSQEIQDERKSQFENDLMRKQNEFTRAMSVPVPEIPKFGEDLDKPIGSAMDELIAKTLAERNYEIQQIQRQMPPPQQSQEQTQQQIKYIKIGEEVKGPVMTPIDVNDVFGRTPEKTMGVVKNVSWGENEYQEYSATQQQPQHQDEPGFNHLFSKLKKMETKTQEQQDIQDLKLYVSEIQKQMTSIHEKMEILLNRIK